MSHPAAFARMRMRASEPLIGMPVRWNRSIRTASRDRSEKVPSARFDLRPNRQVRYVSGIE
ncbi:hypothetical protein DF153_27175 [Burkholderia cenocepacia]|nr:hypothetical protein DF152_12015 [Burkholderia cenocepacia]RQU16970.1 hypothetical protein DF153_27175 [Burkholderia cenocepacia]